jgi:hypothetical protein
MNSHRRAALSAGVLFITATAASVSATTLLQPVLNHSDYLIRISTHGNLWPEERFSSFSQPGQVPA